MSKQSIAIIGGGIAGLTSARYLHQSHDISLFEYNDYIGGHTHTLDVTVEGKTYPINTGFIVYNDWVYHNFNKLMSELDVKRIPTEMSFSVSDQVTGLEYNGHNLDTLFAQRKNLFSPGFLNMIRDILRFNKESLQDLAADKLDEALTLGDYFKQKGLGQMFIDKYIIPMGAAIWSSGEADMLDFPALFFVRFFKNHGLLAVKDRPQWYVLEGGSRSYVEPLIEPFKNNVHLNARIKTVRRHNDYVELLFDDNQIQRFDQVIFACHSDQALALLDDANSVEKEILGKIPYSKNEVVLQDPTEQNLRKILNYGHTLGHAVESYFLESPDHALLLHGEAIAIGMVLEGWLSHVLEGLPLNDLSEIKSTFAARYPKIEFAPSDIDGILSLLKFDKKNSHGNINFVLLKGIGQPVIDVQIDEKLLRGAFAYYSE